MISIGRPSSLYTRIFSFPMLLIIQLVSFSFVFFFPLSLAIILTEVSLNLSIRQTQKDYPLHFVKVCGNYSSVVGLVISTELTLVRMM